MRHLHKKKPKNISLVSMVSHLHLRLHGNYSKKAANAQDAHEAIRPTSILRDPDSIKSFMSRDQFRLYKLVWERFVASQMSSAILDTLSVDIAAGTPFSVQQVRRYDSKVS